MKLLANESLITAAAEYTGGNFNYLWCSDNNFDQVIGEAIVDWVDNSGDQYFARFDFVKTLFPNFSY